MILEIITLLTVVAWFVSFFLMITACHQETSKMYFKICIMSTGLMMITGLYGALI